MSYKVQSTATFAALGRFQQPILDAVSRGLPGAAAHYAPLPQGKPALVVVSTLFENRDEGDRWRLVETATLSLGIAVTDYVAGIQCFTPKQFDELKDFDEV